MAPVYFVQKTNRTIVIADSWSSTSTRSGATYWQFATFDPGFGQLENVTSSSSFRLRLPQSVAPSEGLLPT